MLANGSMPMLSTAAQADSRLAAAGDMLSLPDDRRNLASASSSSPAAVTGADASASTPSTTTSAGKMDESQQDKGRAASPAPPLAVAGKEEGSASRSSAEKSKLPCALDPRSNERKAATDTNNYNSSSSDAKKTTMSTLPNAKLTGPRAAEVAASNTNEQAPRSSPQPSPPALPQQKKPAPSNVPKPAKSDSYLAADKDSATTSIPKAKTTETGEASMPSLPPAAAPATAGGAAAAAKYLAPAREAADGVTSPAPSENGNGAREKMTGPTEDKAQSVKPVASQHDDDTSNNNNRGSVGMAVDEDEQQEKVPEARGVTPPSTPSSMAANTILVSLAPARDCVEPRGKGASAAAPAVAAHEVEVCRKREERDGGQEGYQEQQGGAAGSAAASGDAVVEMELAEREEGMRHGGKNKVTVPHALALQYRVYYILYMEL